MCDLEKISAQLPCRRRQLELLQALLGRRCSLAVPSLFIYGHTATGKSSTLKHLIPELKHKLVCVNCVECYSSRLLFETILLKLRGREVYERCDSLSDFVRSLRLIVDEMCPDGEAVYILLENSERLRDSDANLLPGLLRLQELSQTNVGVILESEIVLEKFRSGTGFREPYIIHFPDYTKDELVEIMTLDIPNGCPVDAYSGFVRLLLDIFHLVCNNLSELRYLASINFRKYAEPVERGDSEYLALSSQGICVHLLQASENFRIIGVRLETPLIGYLGGALLKWENTMKLWRNIEPHLKKSLQTVYLREISGVQWEKMQLATSDTSASNATIRSLVELPVYSKYLLIAAYLASYNPAKSDKRFFSKHAGKISRRTHGALKKTHERTTNQLLGPKVFPVDRLLAIFYSIVNDRVAPSANIFCQISSLVTLGLLTQVSNSDALESPKYKCIVSLEFIKSVARSINFEVVRYIYDFV